MIFAIIAVFFLLFATIKESTACDLDEIQKNHCFPFPRNEPISCLMLEPKNASGLNWFQMKEACEQGGGRLVWLPEDLSRFQGITSSLHAEKFRYIFVGMLVDRTDVLYANQNPEIRIVYNGIETHQTVQAANGKKCLAINSTYSDGRFANHSKLAALSCSEVVENASYECEYQCKGALPNVEAYKLKTSTAANPHPNSGGVTLSACNVMGWILLAFTVVLLGSYQQNCIDGVHL